MQERTLNILVGKQKQCIEITHSGLVDCCEFACCGFAHDTINLLIAPVGITLSSSDRFIATADNDNDHPLPPHPRVLISAGASISLVNDLPPPPTAVILPSRCHLLLMLRQSYSSIE